VMHRDVAVAGVYQGRKRVTLTYGVIDRTRQILWVVTGEEKVKALWNSKKVTSLFRADGFAGTGRSCLPMKLRRVSGRETS